MVSSSIIHRAATAVIRAGGIVLILLHCGPAHAAEAAGENPDPERLRIILCEFSEDAGPDFTRGFLQLALFQVSRRVDGRGRRFPRTEIVRKPCRPRTHSEAQHDAQRFTSSATAALPIVVWGRISSFVDGEVLELKMTLASSDLRLRQSAMLSRGAASYSLTDVGFDFEPAIFDTDTQLHEFARTQLTLFQTLKRHRGRVVGVDKEIGLVTGPITFRHVYDSAFHVEAEVVVTRSGKSQLLRGYMRAPDRAKYPSGLAQAIDTVGGVAAYFKGDNRLTEQLLLRAGQSAPKNDLMSKLLIFRGLASFHESRDGTGLIDEAVRASPYFVDAQQFASVLTSDVFIGKWNLLLADDAQLSRLFSFRAMIDSSDDFDSNRPSLRPRLQIGAGVDFSFHKFNPDDENEAASQVVLFPFSPKIEDPGNILFREGLPR